MLNYENKMAFDRDKEKLEELKKVISKRVKKGLNVNCKTFIASKLGSVLCQDFLLVRNHLEHL